MWSPNELLKIEKQRDILSYITLQFFHFKKVPLEHCPFGRGIFLCLSYSGTEKKDKGKIDKKKLWGAYCTCKPPPTLHRRASAGVFCFIPVSPARSPGFARPAAG